MSNKYNTVRLGVDVDGVLADFNTNYIAALERVSPVRFPEVSSSYPNTWHYERAAGVSKADEEKVWDEIWKSPFFWATLGPLNQDVQPFLKDLQKMAYSPEIYFITSRNGFLAKQQTEDWLESMGVHRPTVVISGHKGILCDSLKIDYYLDDRTENCEDVSKVGSTKCFMLKAPWNRQVTDVPRLESLGEFISLVRADWTGRGRK